MKQTLAFTLLLLLSMPSFGDSGLFGKPAAMSPSSVAVLPVDEAFSFGYVEQQGHLKLFWQILPGYYLYRDKLALLVDGEAVPLPLPAGEQRNDEFFGEVMVLTGLVEVMVAWPDSSAMVTYQGCAELGYCYPPQKKQVNSDKSQLISEKGGSISF